MGERQPEHGRASASDPSLLPGARAPASHRRATARDGARSPGESLRPAVRSKHWPTPSLSCPAALYWHCRSHCPLCRHAALRGSQALLTGLAAGGNAEVTCPNSQAAGAHLPTSPAGRAPLVPVPESPGGWCSPLPSGPSTFAGIASVPCPSSRGSRYRGPCGSCHYPRCQAGTSICRWCCVRRVRKRATGCSAPVQRRGAGADLTWVQHSVLGQSPTAQAKLLAAG